MSQAVLADAQFGIARILKPYKYFPYGYDSRLGPTTEAGSTLIARVPAGGITIPTAGWLSATFDLVLADTDMAAVVASGIVNGANPMLALAGYGVYYCVSVDTVTKIVTLKNTLASNFTGSLVENTLIQITSPGGYNGFPGQIPLMFTEGGAPFDEQAGRAGYSDSLLRGIPVPMGARVLIWLPKFSPTPEDDSEQPETSSIYQWEFSFRIRNLLDFSVKGGPYHLAASRAGAPADLNSDQEFDPDTQQVRVPIAASDHAVIFNGVEPPSSPYARIVTERVLKEGFQTRAARDLLPLVPNKFAQQHGTQANAPAIGTPFVEGNGMFQQGITSNGQSGEFPDTTQVFGFGAFAPQFTILEIQCPGDEMLVSLTKVSGVATTSWDFGRSRDTLGTPDDRVIVNLFASGYEYMGVYVMPGSAP